MGIPTAPQLNDSLASFGTPRIYLQIGRASDGTLAHPLVRSGRPSGRGRTADGP